MRFAHGLLIMCGLTFTPFLHGQTVATTPEDVAADEQLLKEAKVSVDGAGLLTFFRQHTPATVEEKHIAELVRRLGAEEYQEREKATIELEDLGIAALPFLKPAARHPDPEVRRRVNDCLQTIERNLEPARIAAAARLVRVRKPEGAAAVLMRYLPYAEEETVEEEVLGALLVAGTSRGQ